jgi:hypothetical protein
VGCGGEGGTLMLLISPKDPIFFAAFPILVDLRRFFAHFFLQLLMILLEIFLYYKFSSHILEVSLAAAAALALLF